MLFTKDIRHVNKDMGGQNEASNLHDEQRIMCLTRDLMDQKRHWGKEKPSQQKLKNTNFSKMMVGHGKGVLKRYNFMLQDEELPTYETMESLSPHQSHMRRVSSLNHDEEDFEEEEHEVDSFRNENIGSTSHGMSNTRNESRALNETKKRRSNKANLVFEVDECAGRIVGEDSQQFITKGGCVVRDHAKFDGTTWKKQPDLLKYDIITKCTENSTYDPSCRSMVRAIDTQLANQHKNRQYRLHLHFKKFSTKEKAINHPPNDVINVDWVKPCHKFASEEFQKVSIRNKKNKSFNQVPPAVGTVSIARIVDMNELLNEEASSSCSPVEICMKNYILQMELELEKEKSKALEEEIRVIKEEQLQFQEEQIKYREEQNKKMEFMMSELSHLFGCCIFYALNFVVLVGLILSFALAKRVFENLKQEVEGVELQPKCQELMALILRSVPEKIHGSNNRFLGIFLWLATVSKSSLSK
uniref:Uncharacterized protein n=1 Tax=Lactuca sativa TaxID=4236 RepID=A0A9R1UMX6_LACSA|nr:hypothetical protein LSAT_V11C800430690 [Lactuca sativa]